MRALVTGANGFLGRHVVGALRRRGVETTAMVRPATNVDRLPWDDSIRIVRADLRVERDLEALLEGVDVVVHLAASVGGDDELQFQSTVVGTERLLDAMERAGVRRLVLASSFSVYDWSKARGVLDERTPVEADLYERDGYAVAKVWQERVVRRRSSIESVILRPGFIWGPGNEYAPGVGQRAGPLHVVVAPLGRLPLTHVVNCAEAFALATERADAPPTTLNVIDDPPPRTWTFAGQIIRGLRIGGVRAPLPYVLGMLTARAGGLTSLALFGRGGKLPSILTPCRFEARFKPLRFPNDRLKEALGWAPTLDHEGALRATFDPEEAARWADARSAAQAGASADRSSPAPEPARV